VSLPARLAAAAGFGRLAAEAPAGPRRLKLQRTSRRVAVLVASFRFGFDFDFGFAEVRAPSGRPVVGRSGWAGPAGLRFFMSLSGQ
jgi:hypothetical protein